MGTCDVRDGRESSVVGSFLERFDSTETDTLPAHSLGRERTGRLVDHRILELLEPWNQNRGQTLNRRSKSCGRVLTGERVVVKVVGGLEYLPVDTGTLEVLGNRLVHRRVAGPLLVRDSDLLALPGSLSVVDEGSTGACDEGVSRSTLEEARN